MQGLTEQSRVFPAKKPNYMSVFISSAHLRLVFRLREARNTWRATSAPKSKRCSHKRKSGLCLVWVNFSVLTCWLKAKYLSHLLDL